MKSPQIPSRKPSRRRWPWLFAALLPVALFAVIAERNSWRPRQFSVGTFVGDVWEPIAWEDNRKLWIVNRGQDVIQLQCWDTQNKRLLFNQNPPNSCEPATVAPMGHGYFNCFDSSGTSLLWHPMAQPVYRIKGMDLWQIPADRGLVIGFSAINGTICFTSDGCVESLIWDRRSKQVIKRALLKPPSGFVFAPKSLNFYPALSTDGTVGIVDLYKDSGSTEAQCLLIFDPRTGQHQRVLRLANGPQILNESICSPDGKLVAVTIQDKTPNIKLQIHSVTGELKWEFQQQSAALPIFSPDSCWLATRLFVDNKIRIWNAKLGLLQREIQLKKGFGDIAFSPDGRTLAVLQNDGNLTLWRVF